MWYLTSLNDSRVIYLTSRFGKVTIGRSTDGDASDFTVSDDTSVSRKHAVISLVGDDLVVTDLGSKFGTFVKRAGVENAEQIEANQVVKVTTGDHVKFGVMSCEWTARSINLVSCSSTVKGENLVVLKKCLESIGGCYKTDWDDSCSYLTMPAISLTIKVVLALVQGSHIVTLDYWKKCSEAVTSRMPLPNPNNYIPVVIESTLNKETVSFAPDNRRRDIFTGRKFIFFSRRQMDMYKSVLEKAAATTLLLSEVKMTKSMLCASDVIVIQYIMNNTTQESQAQKNQIDGIVNFIKSKGKRVVADAEIGLAILSCSTEKYCNPDFNMSSEVLNTNNQNQQARQPNVLAPDTQEATMKIEDRTNMIIDESLTPMKMGATETSSKRKHEEDENTVQNPQKKVARVESIINFFDNDDEIFNFDQADDQNDPDPDIEAEAERLNFTKPVKRKTDELTSDDDNLFNFVQPTIDTSEVIAEKIFETKRLDEFEPSAKRPKMEQEYKPLVTKGLSIKQLLENSVNWKSSDMIEEDIKVKTEDITEELEERINELDIGSTVVTINRSLVKESLDSILIDDATPVKNFKKFKKVWPINMKVTIIPKSSMTIVKPDASVMDDVPVLSDSEEEIEQTKLKNGKNTIQKYLVSQ